MSRTKKTRKVKDILPTRKSDQKVNDKISPKKKKIKKGKSTGSRYNVENKPINLNKVKVTNSNLVDKKSENKKAKIITEDILSNKEQMKSDVTVVELDLNQLEKELFEIENNDYFNKLIDELDQGNKLSKIEQDFVEKTMARYQYLVEVLNIDDDENPDNLLYDQFNNIDINKFK